MSVFNIKATQETTVPIFIPFVYVGEIGIFAPVAPLPVQAEAACCPCLMGQYSCCSPCIVHVISKWGMTPSFMPASLIAPTLTYSTTREECTCLKWSLLHWDGELLDRWHLESVPCNKPSGVFGRLLHKAQSHHLSCDSGLVC